MKKVMGARFNLKMLYELWVQSSSLFHAGIADGKYFLKKFDLH